MRTYRCIGKCRRKLNGTAKCIYKYGNYIGQFKNCKRNGDGTMTWNDGQKYRGQWKNDKREGNGSRTWTDGSRFNGRYKGCREGFGR